MAHALAAGARCATHLIHAWGGEGPRPFAEELAALAVRAANLRVAACLSGDGSAKEGEGAARFTGRIDADLLRAVLPIGDYEVYLCGPPAFMQAMYDLLTGLGVREERISYEFFGPAKRLARGVAGRAPAAAEAPAPAAMEPPASAAEPVVSFARLGRSAAWDPSCRTLLDFAERQGLEPPFSCRNGICNTCLCVVEGKVRYVEEPLEEPPEGQVHLCCTAPDGPVSLSL
jgi:ferredoxin